MQSIDDLCVGADFIPVCLLSRNLAFNGRRVRFGIELETLAKLLKVVGKFLVKIPDACREGIPQAGLLGSADFSGPSVLVHGEDSDHRDHHNHGD